MNLTIEQVSKLTKLSVPTLYVYSSRLKLGKKVGNKKVFSQADVQKLLKSSRKSPPAKKATSGKKSPAKKRPTSKAPARKRSRGTIKARPISTSDAKARPVPAVASAPVSTPTKPTFWARLFGGSKPKQKVSLMDAKTK